MTRPAAVPTVLVDDTWVCVTRWAFAPGAETGWHRHDFAYVVIPETHCSFLLEEPGGGERRIEQPAGAVYRRDAGVEHNVVNGGTEPMSFIEVEIKAGTAP